MAARDPLHPQWVSSTVLPPFEGLRREVVCCWWGGGGVEVVEVVVRSGLAGGLFVSRWIEEMFGSKEEEEGEVRRGWEEE